METFACPACGSEIATDGRALHKRSVLLVELEKAAALVPKLEQAIAQLETETAQPRAHKVPRKTKPARPAVAPSKGETKHELVSTQREADPDDEFLR